MGTIVRIYDRAYSAEGQLATAHWATKNGLFFTLHDESKSDFVNLTHQTWVVDHRCVKSGSMLLHYQQGSNDIKDDLRNKTISEVKLRNSPILMNHKPIISKMAERCIMAVQINRMILKRHVIFLFGNMK